MRNYEYSAPKRLENDWREGRKTPPETMVEELQDDINDIRRMIDEGRELIPVQGRVSDYKSWLAAAMAMEMSNDGRDVTVFAPQRTNRESAVTKLELFGARIIEHPGRFDLCIWDPWRESVGYVDKSTCESIGCPYYVDNENDIADRTEEAMASHHMQTGGQISLDTETMREMGGRDQQDMCPAQLYLHARTMDITDGTVNVATYAKAFADAAIADDDPLDSDVVLLDEAHTVAADPEVVMKNVEPGQIMSGLEVITNQLNTSAERWARRAEDEIVNLQEAVEHWFDVSRAEHVDPDDIFEGATTNLSDAFSALETVDSRLTQAMRRAMSRGDRRRGNELAGPYKCVKMIRAFLSRINNYRSGNVDFVHSLYEASGKRVNEMAFRSLDESVSLDEGTTPGAVYRQWQEDGTHPAIDDRFAVMGHFIEQLWEGRQVRSTNDLPGAPMMPIDRLQQIAGADSVVTLSATHNEVSDPFRDPTVLRPTRHKLLCAPMYLRAQGSERRDYSGKNTVSPDTPWFRDMIIAAKEESGDNLAAVPINFSNRQKWQTLPVESLETDEGTVHGIVPHSRGSIGEKGLESLDIDTVMCGIQVQSPAPTARRLVQWWELLAPRYDDPKDVLDASWRMLAQHAVSGTIQAGGRFDWDATNLVFERPELLELAGFEVEVATTDSPGFAGALCRVFERTKDTFEERQEVVNAVRIVRRMEDGDRLSPTMKQVVGGYQRKTGANYDDTIDALERAIEEGRIGTEGEGADTRFYTT